MSCEASSSRGYEKHRTTFAHRSQEHRRKLARSTTKTREKQITTEARYQQVPKEQAINPAPFAKGTYDYAAAPWRNLPPDQAEWSSTSDFAARRPRQASMLSIA